MMTVGELKQMLENANDDSRVDIRVNVHCESCYHETDVDTTLEMVQVREAGFIELICEDYDG